MAEKRVSVRLVAEGGRQVRAELEGVGEAGAKGFGRLSREMELANTRLAGFARRAGIAMSAAAAAATASLGLIVRSTAESAAQIRQFAQVANATPEALQRWSAGAQTVGIEQEKLADILKDVNDRVGDFLQTGGGPMADFFESVAPRVGVTADQFARLSGPEALQLYVDTLERAGLSQQEMTFYLEAMASDATRLLPLLRNGGAEMARLGDQAADLGAVLDADAIEAMRRTQVALGTLSLVFEGLRNRIAVAVAPSLEALANAFVALAADGGILRSAIDALIGNLGRLATYATTFAAVMAGRWVAGLAAAALSVRGLATALVFLRGALIRTGIGALIVGTGELVYQFSQLVSRVGSVGEAFRLLGDLAKEVWSRMRLSLDAAFANMAAGWEGLKAAAFSALEGTIAGVVSFGDRTAAIFQGAYDAAVAIWGSLPGAIGDFAFQAANGLISGVEAMLNGVVTRINTFITGLNAALALLPDWAVGEGGVRIGTLDPLDLGRIGNPFEGAATTAGTAAADAFSGALSRTYLEPPDLGLGTMAEDARGRADGYREAAGMLADAAGRPLASWQALRDAVTGTGSEAEVALADAASSADALAAGLNDTATAADGAGGAARNAGAVAAAGAGAEQAATGWAAVTAALAGYANKARDIGGDIGQTLVGAFQSAENAVGDFVKSGKLDFRDLVTSMIADLAKLAARRFILGPIANALSGALGGASELFANILHAGGVVGSPGPGRMVPALAFAGAPRMHAGGWAGIKPDEVPAILQRGERVLSRREAAGYGQGQGSAPNISVTIMSRDAESFRQSRTQVAADIARAVSLGRRGM
ncbi:phage tail tape measure C-terminal domain-containing protein [Oceaniovalibus sp. ACAM 378]|uniref:phage tail tape measure C-terminal domain-containing protein n=1 Tax=Oceaniovalibus sp. ACAM 378 TaxID=2599923 RepID=UPI0011DAB089|nr:phage tail tape measure C-terminal domain-containing protein [Oceaniovalibus sp. ACAM 378]TYB86022.1 phage tail tape measure protein [Oceaniovalibus sp. ACAM 378]